MKIEHGLLVREVYSPDRQVRIVAKATTIDTIDQDILVWRKQGRHWKRTNEIGDGMEVVYFQERPFLIPEQQYARIATGLGIRKEYDETTDTFHTYLYKYPKQIDALSFLNLALADVGVNAFVQGRFVEVEGISEQRLSAHDLTLGGVGAALSFLYGLVLGYGKFIHEGTTLHNVLVRLPLTGPIAQHTSLIDHLLHLLTDHGMYVTARTSAQPQGQLLQLTISDREVMSIFAKWLPVGQFDLVAPYELVSQQKASLKEWVASQSADVALIQQIDYSVLKTIQK